LIPPLLLLQETQLSLTKRATHLCKCIGVADLEREPWTSLWHFPLLKTQNGGISPLPFWRSRCLDVFSDCRLIYWLTTYLLLSRKMTFRY